MHDSTGRLGFSPHLGEVARAFFGASDRVVRGCFLAEESILFYSVLLGRLGKQSEQLHRVARAALFYSILFYSILFNFILFYSIPCYSMLFYSILFYSIRFYCIVFYPIERE